MMKTKSHGYARNSAEDRSALSRDLASHEIVGFWDIRAQFEQTEPAPGEYAQLWRYKDYRALGQRASRTIPVEEADRRNLFFANRGLNGQPLITTGLFGGVQIINPGEVAPVHRHTGCASRLHLEGEGGYTTVEGDRCLLERGDVVINPNWAWHENGNVGKAPIMWFDVLDIPFTRQLNANFFDNDYREPDARGRMVARKYQTVRRPDNWSACAYGNGGLRPAYVSHHAGLGYGSPQMLFKYGATRDLLGRLQKEEGSPWDGIVVEYYSLYDGGPVMNNLGVHMRLLRAAEKTRQRRSSAAIVYCCLEGRGSTFVEGRRLDWGANDVWVVPSWSWHSHANAGKQIAVVYSVSLAPALSKLGLLIEERRLADGSIERLQRKDN